MRSKDEILAELTGIPKYRLTADDKGEYIIKSYALRAMDEYVNEVMREEQAKFKKFWNWFIWQDEIKTSVCVKPKDGWVKYVDEYGKEYGFDELFEYWEKNIKQK